MIAEWVQRVGSSIPRGFSRYFILELLKNQPCTGKEIIDYAIKQSEGIWKPSPGLIYPLLGRLLDEGLIEERDGRYQATKRGKETAEDVDKINDVIKKQLEVIFRLGNAGRFVTIDLLERISMMASMLSSNITNMTDDEIQRYRNFLQDELRKIEGKNRKRGREIKIE